MDSSGNITDDDFINDITEDENENHDNEVLLSKKKEVHNNMSFKVEHTTEFQSETHGNISTYNDSHDADIIIASLRKEKKMMQENLSRWPLIN